VSSTVLHRLARGAGPPDRPSRGDGEAGQGLAEYALILVLIAIVAILSLIFIGDNLSTMLSNIGNSI
jgi:Flp pilus assembly pilin Flp